MIIISKNIPSNLLSELKKIGEVQTFLTNNKTDTRLAGHVDMFCCKVDETYVVEESLYSLINNVSNILPGESKVKTSFHHSPYNAVITDDYILHNTTVTDKIILQLTKNKKQINVKQSFTRCSVIPLPDGTFITSDKGISKILTINNIQHLLVDNEKIVLPGFKKGCIGGCCGINKLDYYLTGSLEHHSQGKAIKRFMVEHGCNVIELVDDALFDCGSFFFI